MEKKQEFKYESASLLRYDPIVLVLDVCRRWLAVAVITVIAGIACYIITDYNYKPRYQSEATLVVTTQDSTSTVYSNLKSTSELAAVFTRLLNSSVLQNRILEELNLTAWDYSIYADAIAETNLLTLKVTAGDPRTAFLVIRSLIENHEIVTYEVVGDIVIEVLQLPQVPTAPVNGRHIAARVRRAMALAALGSCALLLFFSFSRGTVRSKKEAEAVLDCWCLGEIRHERKYKTFSERLTRRRMALTITNPGCSFNFVETIRKLRRRVEQYMGDGKILMVTSVVENEGKSTAAVNLALSFAKKKKRVLLIDMDLRKPACRKILEYKENSRGTREVLAGTVKWKEAVVTDPLSGLDMILERPVRKDTVRTTDSLIVSGGTEALLRETAGRYDYVIIDLPPMSVAADTEYVMEYADAVLLVVQQNLVSARIINKAIMTLERGHAKLLGCVLNNVYTSRFAQGGSGHYGYGYGYGYGRYGRYGKYASRGVSRSSDSEEAAK